MKELPYFCLRCCQRFSPERSCPVYSPQRLAVSLLGRPQVSLLFEALKERIQAPRTDAVSVTRQFFDHPQTEDRTFNGVVEYMEPDQARVQVTVGCSILLLGIRFRHRITNSDIMGPNGGACQLPPVGRELAQLRAAVILGGPIPSTVLNLLVMPALFQRRGRAAIASSPGSESSLIDNAIG